MGTSTLPDLTNRAVVIFDGHCNLCNSSVDRVIRWEKGDYFLFASNQSEPGGQILRDNGIEIADGEEVNTIFLYENGKLYNRSTAVLRMTRNMKFPWILAYPQLLIPRFIRDFVYKIVARNRYKWFGRKDTCRIPTPEERAKFLG